MLSRAQRGFNLIELMVGLTIIAMLLFAGVPSFQQFMRNREVRTVAESIVEGVNLARSEAVTRNTNVNFALSGAGWGVGCVIAGSTCPATIQERKTAEAGSSNVAWPSATITFNGFGRASSIAPGSNITINVTSILGACEDAGGKIRCLRVVVAPGGQIRMCDPKLTSTNPSSPQAC